MFEFLWKAVCNLCSGVANAGRAAWKAACKCAAKVRSWISDIWRAIADFLRSKARALDKFYQKLLNKLSALLAAALSMIGFKQKVSLEDWAAVDDDMFMGMDNGDMEMDNGDMEMDSEVMECFFEGFMAGFQKMLRRRERPHHA